MIHRETGRATVPSAPIGAPPVIRPSLVTQVRGSPLHAVTFTGFTTGAVRSLCPVETETDGEDRECGDLDFSLHTLKAAHLWRL
ncbi:hypothetical protein SRHO_G00139460 [Serrasalmus rhombeus]